MKFDVVLVLYPQFKDAPLFQALLTNLGVVLFDGLITQLNDSIEGYAFVEENAAVGGHAAMGGHAVVGVHTAVEKNIVVGDDESDEDALLFDCSDRRLSSDGDLDVNFMQANLDRAVDGAADGAAEPTIVYADSEDNEGSGGSERLKGSHLEADSDDNLSDVDKEIKKSD